SRAQAGVSLASNNKSPGGIDARPSPDLACHSGTDFRVGAFGESRARENPRWLDHRPRLAGAARISEARVGEASRQVVHVRTDALRVVAPPNYRHYPGRGRHRGVRLHELPARRTERWTVGPPYHRGRDPGRRA